MKTTSNLDPPLITTAKRLAAARSAALGDMISELATKGLEAQSQFLRARFSEHKCFDSPTIARVYRSS